MVNWCPGKCESAISDLEAEPQEHESSLWYINYPIINDDWKGPSGEWVSGEWAKGAMADSYPRNREEGGESGAGTWDVARRR